MTNYYRDKLAAQRLKRCYDIAPSRIRHYLQAEVDHVLRKIHPGDMVLDMGCGYGRIFGRLAEKAGQIIGIDIALDNLLLGRKMGLGVANSVWLQMDAVHLAFRDRVFDVVICIQNGISAFHVDSKSLIRESLRVTKPGGIVLFSSYSEKFWEDRLRWFELQSETGLLGEIDRAKTHDGVIVCKDGFTATTVRPGEFLSLAAELHVEARIEEVDDSSLFCEMKTSSF